MAKFDPKRVLPAPVRRFGRAAYEYAHGNLLDAADWARGRRAPPLTPPRRLWHLITVKGADFHSTGADLRDFLIAQGLRPEHRVLDVGCGIGRLAVALTGYLSDEGAYDGFDIMPVAIRWCRRITRAHPNFRFQLVNLKSDRYRPGGAKSAREFVFPYPDASFDFVVLTSVFTHMLPADMENYLGEIARVTKPGGQAMVSYFVMTPERRALADQGRGAFRFQHRGDGFWAELPDLPEAALAYDEADVLAALARQGLAIVHRFGGEWATSDVQSQDVFLVRRAGAPVEAQSADPQPGAALHAVAGRR